MNETQQLAYWMTLSHLPNWGNEKINALIIEILHSRKMAFDEFFGFNGNEWHQQFKLNKKDSDDLITAKSELANYAFLTESLLNQGFSLIPISSGGYSKTLKQNLKTKAPPLLYVKGNKKLLNEESVAIVGSRKASEISLSFTKNIAKQCAKNYQVVVSGFAKGVDKMALDATLEFKGHSIIVLPQGIMSFSSGFKKYYKQIIQGDVLVLSTYHPKVPWSVGLAMNRNRYIYGLAEKIYVAESDSTGGTWSGATDGLKRGHQLFVRKPAANEKNANKLLISKGAVPVDMNGNELTMRDVGVTSQADLFA